MGVFDNFTLIRGETVAAAAADASLSHTAFHANTHGARADQLRSTFRRLVVKNSGASDAVIAINQDSTSADSELIPIASGESYSADAVGTAVHYSSASGTDLDIQLFA